MTAECVEEEGIVLPGLGPVGVVRRSKTAVARLKSGSRRSPTTVRSAASVYRIGRVSGGRVTLDTEPAVLAVLDGLKVESLAIREQDGKRQIFIGTDDENYGGILRPLPQTGAGRP